jgi:hypothetical protein
MSDVEELQQWIARVEQALADLQETVTDAVASGGGLLLAKPRPPLIFGNVEEFVTTMFAPRFARSIGGPVNGARIGGTTPKRYSDSKPSGAPGRPTASTPTAASPSGTATSPTPNSPRSSTTPAPSPPATPTNTHHARRCP